MSDLHYIIMFYDLMLIRLKTLLESQIRQEILTSLALLDVHLDVE